MGKIKLTYIAPLLAVNKDLILDTQALKLAVKRQRASLQFFGYIKSKITMTKAQAIDAIITYETLPPQIDYTKPYWFKAARAHDYLQSLPIAEQTEAFQYIEEQVSLYNTPSESEYSQAELDSMF